MSRLGWAVRLHNGVELPFALDLDPRTVAHGAMTGDVERCRVEVSAMNRVGVALLTPGHVCDPVYRIIGARDGKLVLREAAAPTR